MLSEVEWCFAGSIGFRFVKAAVHFTRGVLRTGRRSFSFTVESGYAELQAKKSGQAGNRKLINPSATFWQGNKDA